MRRWNRVLAVSIVLITTLSRAQDKPPVSFDDVMNLDGIIAVNISPDGQAVVIGKWAADYKSDSYRYNLWLWTQKTGQLKQLTHSNSDSSPVFSPDGKYIAFESYRPTRRGSKDDDDPAQRVWIIPVDGGEAFPLYTKDLKAHAFDWAADSSAIYFSVQEPPSKAQEDKDKAEWKDVQRYRAGDRGDLLLKISVDDAMKNGTRRRGRKGTTTGAVADDQEPLPADAKMICKIPVQIAEISVSPQGQRVAFATQEASERSENPAASEIYVVSANGGEVKQLTSNQAVESNLNWQPDGKELCFAVPAASGSLEGAYQDVQGRVYQINPDTKTIQRLGGDFTGSWESYAVTADGKVLGCGLTGIEQHLYRIDGKTFTEIASLPGTYDRIATARSAPKIAFTHSTLNDPTQVYLADENDSQNAKTITNFNPIYKQRASFLWQAFHWKSTDGMKMEGVLIYPPGKMGAKNLPMLTLVHGGPADADGNRFDAGWYDWATIAAARGWLVFQPNYRGSTGYGDKFALAIEPRAVSAPGKDVLSGVDALVKEGIADRDHLAIAGYSYGGYITNWLITQTNEFKAAMSGAGAEEQAMEWGTDDSTYDDAWYLGGAPWQTPKVYMEESALFQMKNVKTPTMIVAGSDDVRVTYQENVLLERALQELGVPHQLLTFPGEGHDLNNNPWHGYIKVREELKWMEKYAGAK